MNFLNKPDPNKLTFYKQYPLQNLFFPFTNYNFVKKRNEKEEKTKSRPRPALVYLSGPHSVGTANYEGPTVAAIIIILSYCACPGVFAPVPVHFAPAPVD